MEASELIERFDSARIGDGLLRKAFVMLANTSTKAAAQFLDCAEGMNEYNNYVSESEASEVTANMLNADGSTGAKWTPDTLFTKVESLSGTIEHPTKYNKWALYVAMNMESSDHSAVLQKWSEGDPDKYAEACYDLAVSQLNDKDKPKWIREYFKL